MDLKARKLNAIEYLIHLEDEDVFSKIEETIFRYEVAREKALKPLTEEQLIERARKSNSDYLAGKVKTQDQLETESEKW
ncbi:hypothetical protein [Williamwhitmania taraxaci]|uniref:Addiction module component n=1 Tax=Williamwhitmania taraxaci TaxID=1640674 RepID=A0A1G6HTU0_9BACT|nr:hypothetical protein [Williamwhitmania taraxaci]SDB97255.1 hypothetical protein SAMN05216323_10137 [Williamwhitmania taraxaci]